MSHDYQERAAHNVRQTRDIPDFGYFGDLPIGETWAFTISVHRDSGSLDRSNYRTIARDMETRFPGDVETVHAGHWAVGWIDHLAVRMLDDAGEVTRAGIAALEWADALSSYPVADELDLSEVESQDESDAWENFYEREFRDALEAIFAAGWEAEQEERRATLARYGTCPLAIWPEAEGSEAPDFDPDLDALYELFCAAMERANETWEHNGSDGACVRIDRIVAEIDADDLLALKVRK